MRTHKCGELTKQHIAETVELCGWVHRRRDHGGVIFIDLRDRTGLVQVVFDPEQSDSFQLAETVRSDSSALRPMTPALRWGSRPVSSKTTAAASRR